MEKFIRACSWMKLTATELLRKEVVIEGRVGVIVNIFLDDPKVHIVFDDDVDSVYLTTIDTIKFTGKKR